MSDVGECPHLIFQSVEYHLNRDLTGRYYYTFKKQCGTCGKQFTHDTIDCDLPNFPEGYKGAESIYYNLDI